MMKSPFALLAIVLMALSPLLAQEPEALPRQSLPTKPKEHLEPVADPTSPLDPAPPALWHHRALLANPPEAATPTDPFVKEKDDDAAEKAEAGEEHINVGILFQHIAKLRKKIGDDGNDPALVETVRGVGYRLPSEDKRMKGGSVAT